MNCRLKATTDILSPLVAYISCLEREFKDAAAEPWITSHHFLFLSTAYVTHYHSGY